MVLLDERPGLRIWFSFASLRERLSRRWESTGSRDAFAPTKASTRALGLEGGVDSGGNLSLQIQVVFDQFVGDAECVRIP